MKLDSKLIVLVFIMVLLNILQLLIALEYAHGVKRFDSVRVTLTAYSPREIETDSTPYETAFMTDVKPWTVAPSRDLFWRGWVAGRKVYIEGHGVFPINDLMNKKTSTQLDIFFTTTAQAKEFGVKLNVRAILLDL